MNQLTLKYGIRHALVQFGGGITEIRGSMAGNTFARNRGGAYVRNRVTPVNPNSNFQSEVRNFLSTWSNAWSTLLTQSQREAWNLYGDQTPFTNVFGETVFVHGQAHFVRTNTLRSRMALDPVLDAPTIFQQAAGVDGFGITPDPGENEVAVAFDANQGWVDEDGAGLYVQASRPFNAGTSFIGGPYRTAGVILGDGEVAPTSPTDVAYPFDLAPGQVVQVRARIVRADGRVGPRAIATVEVPA